MGDNVDRAYVDELGEVLRKRDPQELRSFLERSAAKFGDRRQVEAIRARTASEMRQLMHHMILSRPDLRDLHKESRRQLADDS